MPYGIAIYGLSEYGQLSLPLFDKVGGLLRYTEPETRLALTRASNPTPFSLNVLEHETPFTLHRYGKHATALSVQRGESEQTTVALSRSSPTLQLQLTRSSSELLTEILLVRNWSDFTKN